MTDLTSFIVGMAVACVVYTVAVVTGYLFAIRRERLVENRRHGIDKGHETRLHKLVQAIKDKARGGEPPPMTMDDPMDAAPKDEATRFSSARTPGGTPQDP